VLQVRPLTLLQAAAAGGVLALAAAACGPAAQAGGGQSASPAVSSAGSAPGTAAAGSSPGGRVPAPAHTVVVVMENHAYGDIIGSPDASFINALAGQGALFTRSYAVTHPSQPNYLDLFSGSDHGITDDSCPHTVAAPNLGADLIAAHRTFAGYSEGLPATGSGVCTDGNYARRHVPWANFSNVPAADSEQFSQFGAGGYASLPTVSFVIPDVCHDMHDCSVATGDQWLRQHLTGYLSWAMSHDSLLILTWDEDDSGNGNHIVTIFAGQQVKPGHYAQFLTHFGVLRTIEDAYGLPHDGAAASATPVTYIWK
jgi:phosphatidylinositol-3-phosphatase